MNKFYDFFRFLTTKIKQIINYFYYQKSTYQKNIYIYQLLGEKICASNEKRKIIYRMRHANQLSEILLEELFNDKIMIAGFHPVDAKKLGELAFQELILESTDEHKKAKFDKIKKIMLDSIYNAIPSYDKEHFVINKLANKSNNFYYDNSGNIYPYKLVDSKFNISKKMTIVTYTFYGKRDGFEKPLKEIVENEAFISKFHPTEAIKFGFISQGDREFLDDAKKTLVTI